MPMPVLSLHLPSYSNFSSILRCLLAFCFRSRTGFQRILCDAGVLVFVVSASIAATDFPVFAQSSPQLPNLEQGTETMLGSADEITVRVTDFDEIPEKPMRIDAEGYVTIPFVGRIHVAGLSPSQVEKQLAERLVKYLKQPQVTVGVISLHSQPVSVLGAVNKPGVYQLEGHKDLVEALALAGGLRGDAGSTLRVTRQVAAGPLGIQSTRKHLSGKFEVAEVDLDNLLKAKNPELNVRVLPHDVLTVMKADLVYVIGDVRKPGGFTLAAHERLSLLQSLAMAEGLEKTAAPKRARILRTLGDAGERKEIPVDVAGIMSGKSSDVFLQANDVLFVPNNTARSIGMRTAEVALQLGTGILIYRR